MAVSADASEIVRLSAEEFCYDRDALINTMNADEEEEYFSKYTLDLPQQTQEQQECTFCVILNFLTKHYKWIQDIIRREHVPVTMYLFHLQLIQNIHCIKHSQSSKIINYKVNNFIQVQIDERKYEIFYLIARNKSKLRARINQICKILFEMGGLQKTIDQRARCEDNTNLGLWLDEIDNSKLLICQYTFKRPLINFTCFVTADSNYGISKHGQFPWNGPLFNKHFDKFSSCVYTIGKQNAIITDYQTYYNLPRHQQPLKGRVNIVLNDIKDYTNTPDNSCCNYAVSLKPNLKAAIEDVAYPVEGKFIDRVFVFGSEGLVREALRMKECKLINIMLLPFDYKCEQQITLTKPKYSVVTKTTVDITDKQTAENIIYKRNDYI